MIRITFTVSLLVFIGTSCSTTKKEERYSPSTYLSETDQKRIKEEIIRYVAKAPRRVTSDIKFDTTYDEHYAKQVESHELLAYFEAPDGEHFFLVSRIAPSNNEKLVATGGRMRFDDNLELTAYEEVFRTWKLPRPQLEERARYLFDLMVKGEDLTPYYTATAGFNYIEFPDEHVTYDKVKRMWVSDQYGSIEEMVYESRDSDSLRKK